MKLRKIPIQRIINKSDRHGFNIQFVCGKGNKIVRYYNYGEKPKGGKEIYYALTDTQTNLGNQENLPAIVINGFFREILR